MPKGGTPKIQLLADYYERCADCHRSNKEHLSNTNNNHYILACLHLLHRLRASRKFYPGVKNACRDCQRGLGVEAAV